MSIAPIRTLVAVDGHTEQQTLDSVVGDPGIEVVGVLEQQGDLALRSGLDADALLIACNGNPEAALEYLREASRDRPDLAVVVVSAASPNGFLREAFESGADDFVVLGDSAAPGADTFFALQKAVARRSSCLAGEGGGEPPLGLGQVPARPPVPVERGGEAQHLLIVGLLLGPAQRGAEVVVLRLEPVQPCGHERPEHGSPALPVGWRSGFGETDVVRRVPLTDGSRLAADREPLPRVLADGLRHPESGLAVGAPLVPQQALVRQRRHQVQHIGGTKDGAARPGQWGWAALAAGRRRPVRARGRRRTKVAVGRGFVVRPWSFVVGADRLRRLRRAEIGRAHV
jgi:CheY-like chemotaxis protein